VMGAEVNPKNEIHKKKRIEYRFGHD